MKVLHLITKSNFGGAQKYVFELATASAATGHQVIVACGGTGGARAALGPLATRLTAAGVPVYHVRAFQRDMSPLDDLRALWDVWQLLRRERPDVLHLSSSKAGGIGALAGRLAGVPRIVFTSHGLTVDETWRPRWQRALIYAATWLTLALAHVAIMVSSETAARARRMPWVGSRVRRIFNGVAPTPHLAPPAARAALADPLPRRAVWIGGIGELHPNKNWAAAIDALALLPAEVHLFIFGEGEARPALEAQIIARDLSARVHLLGYREAAPYLRAFDLFVLPSLKEGLPYVLLEAGLAELAVVASDLPGNRDIIETGVSGLLVAPEPRALATALEMLVRDEGMRRRMGAALAAHVRTRFSIERMVHDTLACYDSRSSRA